MNSIITPNSLFSLFKLNHTVRMTIGVALGAVLLSACQPSVPTASQVSGDQPFVVATTFPVYDLVRQVAGNKIQVELLMPPGASPHTFEPTPSQMQLASQAELVFAVGLGVDDWAIHNQDQAKVVTLEKNITLLASNHDDHEHESDLDHDEPEHVDEADAGWDPHYWLSLVNASLMIDTIESTLSQQYPEHATEFQQNAEALRQELVQIGNQYQDWCQNSPRIATFHSAWNYLAQDHCVTVVATFEEFPGEEPTPQYLAEFAQEVRSHQVTVVFGEPQFSTRALEAIAGDLGVKLSTLDPLGGQSELQSYAQMMEYNFSQIDQSTK